MNPIEVSHLTKHFSSIVTKRDCTPEFVLDDVSFTVERGYVTGFIGANGSGKTTTIKAVLGMIHPDSGTAATVPHERIGVVFDAPPYNGMWRVRDVGRGLSRFFPTWSDEAFDRQIAGADLDPAKRVKDLSRGMGMRLQMAAALAHAPELLILDEPTGGLDPLARSEMVDALADYMTDEGHTVLFSTHITTDLDRLADRLVILDHGRVVGAGTTDELISSMRIVRGGPETLTVDVAERVFGLRRTSVGWEGMLATERAEALSGVVLEEPTIEDLAIHIAKGVQHSEEENGHA